MTTWLGAKIGERLQWSEIDSDDVVYDMKISALSLLAVGMLVYPIQYRRDFKSFSYFIEHHPWLTLNIILEVPWIIPLIVNKLTRKSDFPELSELALGGLFVQLLAFLFLLPYLELTKNPIYIHTMDRIVGKKDENHRDCSHHHFHESLLERLVNKSLRSAEFLQGLLTNNGRREFLRNIRIALIRPPLRRLLMLWHAQWRDPYSVYFANSMERHENNEDIQLNLLLADLYEEVKHAEDGNYPAEPEAKIEYRSPTFTDRWYYARESFKTEETIFMLELKAMQERNKKSLWVIHLMCEALIVEPTSRQASKDDRRAQDLSKSFYLPGILNLIDNPPTQTPAPEFKKKKKKKKKKKLDIEEIKSATDEKAAQESPPISPLTVKSPLPLADEEIKHEVPEFLRELENVKPVVSQPTQVVTEISTAPVILAEVKPVTPPPIQVPDINPIPSPRPEQPAESRPTTPMSGTTMSPFLLDAARTTRSLTPVAKHNVRLFKSDNGKPMNTAVTPDFKPQPEIKFQPEEFRQSPPLKLSDIRTTPNRTALFQPGALLEPPKIDNTFMVNLTPFEMSVFAILDELVGTAGHNYKTYIVGGWAYDKIREIDQNIPPCLFNDIDLVTEIPPEILRRYSAMLLGVFYEVSEVKNLFTSKFLNVKVDVVHVPDLSDLSLDVENRDFMTFYVDKTGRVSDPTTHALSNLRLGLLYGAKPPEQLFKEDPLVILRAIYVSTKRNLNYENLKSTMTIDRQMMVSRVDDKHLHPRRVNLRLAKLFSQGFAAINFDRLLEIGVFETLLPSIEKDMRGGYEWLQQQMIMTAQVPWPKFSIIYANFMAVAVVHLNPALPYAFNHDDPNKSIDENIENLISHIGNSSLLFRDAFNSPQELYDEMRWPLHTYHQFFMRKLLTPAPVLPAFASMRYC